MKFSHLIDKLVYKEKKEILNTNNFFSDQFLEENKPKTIGNNLTKKHLILTHL